MTDHPDKRAKEDPLRLRKRRRNERVPLRLPVRLGIERSRTRIEATTADISESGMFVLTEAIPVGTSFEFGIDPGDGSSLIHGRGEVIWLNIDDTGASLGVGIRFLHMPAKSSELLRRILDENLPKASRNC